MNYKESRKILEQIKKAKRIMVNCHRAPDPDSVGCALAMYEYLRGLDKEVRVVCPDRLPENLKFVQNFEVVEKVDYEKVDFSKVDLFIALDSGDWKRVTANQVTPPQGLNVVAIDHHDSNTKYGLINIVESEVTSCAEILYLVFSDFGVRISRNMADCLLTGIIGDTGAFQYPGVTTRTLEIVRKLMEIGADKDKIIFNIFRSRDFDLLKFFGIVLTNAQFEKEFGFVWSVLPYKEYKKYSHLDSPQSEAASLFIQTVDGSGWGFIAAEDKPNHLKISFRSRLEFDVSKVAEKLGGGGHKATAGGEIRGLTFDKAVEKVLEVARKYAKEYQKQSKG